MNDAKKLLAEAGYPDGRDARHRQAAGAELRLLAAPRPSKAEIDWMVKQFAKLGIQLEIRATDYNQFQDKVRSRASTRSSGWGWLADYPDAENFLFLLYGPNAKSGSTARTRPTTQNAEYDACYRTGADAGRRPGQAGRDRPDGGHPAARRALVLGLLSLRLGRRSAVGAQRQAQHPDARPWPSTTARPGAARGEACRVEPPVRWPLALVAVRPGWPWCGPRRGVRQRETATARAPAAWPRQRR
jgi:hypothetical protein